MVSAWCLGVAARRASSSGDFVLEAFNLLAAAGAHMKKVRHSIDAQHFPKPATTLPKAVLVIVHGDVIYRRHRVLRSERPPPLDLSLPNGLGGF